MSRSHIEITVSGALPPLKAEAKSLLSPEHKQALRVRRLLEEAHAEKARTGFDGFGARPVAMEVTVRPIGAAVGDATNALGGIGDTLQSERSNIDLSYLGELADAFLYANDKQIREVHYREEEGMLGYTVRLREL